ncbi:alpha/beta hydrolase [Desulfococcaceae bacterium HSG7]|nr:alpha/beta hydrolase [Desulfococcaceae bacterium HSG7]
MLRIILAVLVGFPLTIAAILYIFQEKFLFLPPTSDEAMLQRVRNKFPKCEITLTTPDHVKLHGWYIPGNTTPKSPLLIYFGGNSEDMTGVLEDPFFELTRLRPCALLLVNYRGYGLSEGLPGEKQFFKDAVFLYDHFANRNEIDQTGVIVMGRSLGTGVAVHLASQRTLKGIILVSPYDSITNVAQELYPYIPVSLFIRHPFDSASLASSVKIPLLALTAESDSTISSERSHALLAKWGGPCHHVSIPQVDHNDLNLSKLYWESISNFLRHATGP